MPPGGRLPPLVKHLAVTPNDGLPNLASAIIATTLDLPEDFVLSLIRMGAVHCAPVHPLPKAALQRNMTAERIAEVQVLHRQGVQRLGKNPKYTIPRRLDADAEIHPGSYLRVHLHPKRFPVFYTTDWPSRVLHDAQDYIVMNKPPGIQVPPTVDNMLECLVSAAATCAGMSEQLRCGHRLDAGTEGVVLMPKTSEFAAYFSDLLQQKGAALGKHYRCVTRSPPALGRLVHYMHIGNRTAGEPAYSTTYPSPQEGAVRAELEVASVEEVELTREARSLWGERAYESSIVLLTGRTHQIRAQLAAEGAPLLGDELYTTLHEAGVLQGSKICGEPTKPMEMPSLSRRDFDTHSEAIGLQAFKLIVKHDGRMGDENPRTFAAPAPWWRS